MKFPLAFGLQKTGLPLIVTSGKLKNLCFLIDTGATHNTLFGFVYEHFKEEFNPTSTFSPQNFPVIQHLQFLHIYCGYYKFSNPTELG